MGRFFSPPRRFFSRTPGEGLEIVRHDVSHAALAGFQLAFLSDIHACARFSDTALETLFARVAALDADIVCLGGDLAEDAESLSRLTRFFPLLTPRLGVFACPGNNDHEIDGFSRHVGKYLRLLTNESVRLGGLRLGGVDERKWGRPDARGLFPAGEAVFRVLLAHYPICYDFGAGAKPDLQLSGHTHGGQFNVLGLTPYILPFEPRGHAWISGECTLHGVRTIVSNGVGMSRLCLRVGAPPQAHRVRFTR